MTENSLCTETENLDNNDPNRSTKKVKFRLEDGNSRLNEDADMDIEIIDREPIKDNQPSEKTSFKDKLLNKERIPTNECDEEEAGISLSDADFEIGNDKGVPVINFSDRVHNLIAQNMKFCIIIRLLGKTIGYRTLFSRIIKLWNPKDYPSLVDLDNNFFLVRFYSMDDYIKVLSGGPWVLFGHYLTIQPWNPAFSSDNTAATLVTARVRFPGLPIQYYHNHVLNAIANTIGKVIKIDYNTEAKERGKFARLAINLDLTKPLISSILIDGRLQRVEYEGLPIICFDCGRYGHRENHCQFKKVDVNSPQQVRQVIDNNDQIPATTAEESRFGPWMQVTNQRRKPGFKGNNQAISDKISSGSRYDSIANLEEENHGQDSTNGKKENSFSTLIKATTTDYIENASKAQEIRNNGKINKKPNNSSGTQNIRPMHNHAQVPQDKSSIPPRSFHDKGHEAEASTSAKLPVNRCSTSLDPKNHIVFSIASSQENNNHLSKLKNLSLRDKFSPKGPDKPQSKWSIKINKNSKGSVKARKKREACLPQNSTIEELILEMGVQSDDHAPTSADFVSHEQPARSLSLEDSSILGAASSNFIRTLKSFQDCYNPSLLVIVEPRIAGIKADKVIKQSRFEFSHRVEARGFSGGIWILWNSNVHVNVVLNHRQFIHSFITLGDKNETLWFTAVYGSPQSSTRRDLWRDLSLLDIGNNDPWLLAGDFNAILSSNDRRGGSCRRKSGCPLFNDFVDSNALTQLDFRGPAYTWRRGNLFQRLDRGLCNNNWCNIFPNAITHHLPRIHSDHRPILIKLNSIQQVTTVTKPFRFLSSWITHQDFEKVVTKGWQHQRPLTENINLVTNEISEWNVNVFGNIFKQKKQLMGRLNGIQKVLETRNCSYLSNLETHLQAELNEILLREESFWLQKSRCEWIMFGDRNTSYFHAKTIARRKKNRICMLKKLDGSWCDDDVYLQNMAVSFFTELYTEDDIARPIYNTRGYFPALSDFMLNSLNMGITHGEIHQALFQMKPWKAPGIDGLPAGFYQNDWAVVGNSVCYFIQQTFRYGVMDTELNKTLITLIPKSSKPETIKDFRPISLCTVMYKLVTKIITNRLKSIMPRIINPTQVSFIAGRNITDNIIIAQEVIHSMRIKKGKEGWFAIKVDLEKAYDRLNWNFIEDTLLDVGIPAHIIRVIMHCISSSQMNLLWNGSASQEFKPSRGIRQGDPLSPYIFVLCMERLSHRICLAIQNREWSPIKLNRNGPDFSHLFFADDLVLFGKASEEQGLAIKSILEEFSNSSGLRVSLNKTKIFFSSNVQVQKAESIANVMGFQRTQDLGIYLGVPLLHSRVTKDTYLYILEKIKKKLSGWNASLLSMAGRLTLAKSVLMAIPGYTMQTTALPKGLCDQINRLVRNFVWGNQNGSYKPSLVKWSDMCTPCRNGGSGIQDLKRQNNAFLMKIGYLVITNPELLWVQVIRSKYGWHNNGNSYKISGPCSILWRNLFHLWSTISFGIHWSLGDGSDINFWNDSWLGDLGPLKLLAFSPLNENDLSKKVKDVVSINSWNWDYISQLVPYSVLLHLAAIKPPAQHEGTDQPYWGLTSSGLFSVKSAYIVQDNDIWEEDNSKWRAVWNWPGAQRVRTMLWLAAKNRLMTNSERGRRHMTDETSCMICGYHTEDRDHVLRHCIFAREVWRKLIPPVLFNRFFTADFDVWFFDNLQSNLSTETSNWITTFGITCWNLWTHRNNLVFKNDRRSSDAIVMMINQMVNFTIKAQQFAMLSNPGLGPKVEHLIGWDPPPPNWLKLNSDGAVRGPTNRAASGGVARNSSGEWMFGYSRLIGRCSVLQAELWGALDGLNLAWSRGHKQVILEMDSKLAVDAITNEDLTINANTNLLWAIRDLLKRNWHIQVCHIYREGNRCADRLANIGFSHPLGLALHENQVDDVSSILVDDIAGVSLPRMHRNI
ncbi:uncharacterized protein LOC126667478 [Mercurialis annua]|uniref:uncharacterized protein LOC126667478 n=1 Tax=Mercurialis annua TaxID=3986 RepID=UPI002160CAC0|nr:uncharacterized protein LOC126667478 [Mercurialis annua]